VGNSIRVINEDGTVTCEADSTGDNNYITAGSVYTAGTSQVMDISRDGLANITVSWSDVDTDTDTQLSGTEVISMVGNFSANQSNYYLKAEADAADDNTQLSEAQVEGFVFDADNTGSMTTTGTLNAGTILSSGYVNATTDLCIIGGTCLSAAGTGSDDITAVTTDADSGLEGGAITGAPSLSINDTWINNRIDARSTNDTDTVNTYTGGDAITITAFDIDFDGGASPAGELGGTWANPTVDTSIFDDEYIELGDSFGGEVSGTYGAIVLGHDALDDQYYDSEADLTGLLDNNYQPLEATLTDIADGTIAENLINTANPWADNEVVDTITASSYLPLAGGSMTGNINMTTGNVTTVDCIRFENGAKICGI